MKSNLLIKSNIEAGVFALLFALVIGYAGESLAAAAPVPPTMPVAPPMTIVILNNSTTQSIYPVLSTGTSTFNKWLQAAALMNQSQLAANPYPKLNQFRFYINPADGIPPGGKVKITYPAYTQLVPTNQVDPSLTDQYIDWWGGGRIEIFASPAGSGPPKALTKLFEGKTNKSQVAVTSFVPGAPLPSCINGCTTPLQFFKDPAGLKNNEPDQLTEWTLGAVNPPSSDDPTGPYEFDAHNVDYDVSYVDTAYLPVVMEPFNNSQVGYIGAAQSVELFNSALAKFLQVYQGWPQFVDNQNKIILKIPSALHIFAADPDMTPPPWAPIKVLKNLWRKCTDQGGTDPICARMVNVKNLFAANYNNYVASYKVKSFGCDQNKSPVALTEQLMLRSVYGFTPFNDNCTNAQGNLLADTPGYNGNRGADFERIKLKFDKLQYWSTAVPPGEPTGEFDPYVVLIHGKDYINAPNTYAYSVDDAVGNMQVAGDGLMIAVGGTQRLPNGKPATPPINVSFGFSKKDAIRFVQYGICTTTPNKTVNPGFASFSISANNPNNCPLSFLDNMNQLYTFRLNAEPPYTFFSTPPDPNNLPRATASTQAQIDCSGNTTPATSAWCFRVDNLGVHSGVYAYSSIVEGTKKVNFAVAPAPAQP